jgi:hypothetical protein
MLDILDGRWTIDIMIRNELGKDSSRYDLMVIIRRRHLKVIVVCTMMRVRITNLHKREPCTVSKM